MISSLPDLSALYSPAAPAGADPFAFLKEQDPKGDPPAQGEKADRADLSALAKEFAKKGGAFALFEFEYQSVHAVSRLQDGKGVSRQEYWQQSFRMHLAVGGDSEKVKALLEKLKEQNTPEKVSDRIASFANGITAGKGGAFGDLIRGAVESGYSQAIQMLGPIDKTISDLLEQTMKLVREKMQPKQDQQDKALEQSSIAA